MIGRLTGIVLDAEERFLLLDVGGVGYKIFAAGDTLAAARKADGGPVSFWIHLAVREDALELYGFRTKEELSLFELLIGISGIGPRTALNVLSASSLKNLRRAIGSGETAYLTKISGIGRKLAEKIILELKEKVEFSPGEDDAGAIRDETDALEALESLGYGEREAREALKKLPPGTSGAGGRVKAALKILGKQQL